MLKRIKEQLHTRLLNLRSLEYIISQSSFEKLWAISSEEDRKIASQHILNADKIGVSNWEKNHPSIENIKRTTTELREQAKNLKISNYSRKSREELLCNLKSFEQEKSSKLSQADKLRYISSIIKEMTSELEDAKIPLKYLTTYNKKSIDEINEAFNWIKDLRQNGFKAVLKVRVLVPPEIWKRYETWQLSKNREMLMLEKAQLKLRRLILKRPKFFRKDENGKKINKEGNNENSDGES